MKEWTFKVFVDDNGVSDIDDWLKNGIPPKARAKLKWIIEYMEITKDWTKTRYFRPLTGYSGICEIRFGVQNREYRPLGCRGPKQNEFTFLVAAEEKNNKFDPLSAPTIAAERRNKVLKDERYSNEYY